MEWRRRELETVDGLVGLTDRGVDERQILHAIRADNRVP